MSNSQYICFCRKIFPDQEAFKNHLPCVYLVNAVKKKAKFDIILSKPNEVQMMQRSLKPKSETVYKIVKMFDILPQKNNASEKIIPTASTHLGKRLPSRTKVPFLSRAVPLSTDHSFERCTCGAVFVTRRGKRQHQARFCTLAKNKSKNKVSTVKIENMEEDIQSVPTTEHGNDFINGEVPVINNVYDNHPALKYEDNKDCDE